MTEMPYGPQVLWPSHCIQGTQGAEFHKDLETDGAAVTIRKGFRRDIDSYSAFFENDRTTPTGLAGYLRDQNIKSLVMTGIATDFCVRYSAVDAAKLGFDVTLFYERNNLIFESEQSERRSRFWYCRITAFFSG